MRCLYDKNSYQEIEVAITSRMSVDGASCILYQAHSTAQCCKKYF